MGRHLGIDFSSILVGFGSQVGRENRAKIEEKGDSKFDAKHVPLPNASWSGFERFFIPKPPLTRICGTCPHRHFSLLKIGSICDTVFIDF